MKYLLIVLITSLFTAAAKADQNSHFKTASAVPTALLVKELQNIYDTQIKDKNVISIKVEGHTDQRGSAAYNQSLSDKRAKAAMNELISMGADKSKATSAGKGESDLLTTGTTDLDYARNRRVVVTIVTDKETKVVVVTEADKCEEKVKEVIKEVVKEKKVIKKHLISVIAVRDVVSTETVVKGNSVSSEVQTGYLPSVSYQYQMDSGLVPMVGINTRGKLFGGVGFEF